MKTLASLLLTILLFAVSAVDIQAGSRITVDKTAFDFGYVPQNARISHVFWIHSTGDAPLKITDVKPGCSCTKAPLEKDEIAIGDSTRLEIIFSTKSYRSRVRKQPLIHTNAGDVPFRLAIEANVMPRPDSAYPLVMEPYKVAFSRLNENSAGEKRFEIYNASDEVLELTMVSSASDFFEVDLPGTINPGATVLGKVTVREDKLNNSFEKSFTLRTNDSKSSRFTVPVTQRVRQAFSTR